MRMRWMIVCLVIAAGISTWGLDAQPAWAQDPIHKMGRGLVNVLTGWI